MCRPSYSRFAAAACVLLAGAACSSTPAQRCLDVDALPPGDEVQIIGDSVFDFNEASCEDVSDFLSLALGAQVEDRSVGGTWLDDPDSSDDIVGSYLPGPWAWVVVDGGGNDLLESCGCDCSAEEVARLVNPSGTTGAMPALVEQIVDDGAKVLLFGYYAPTPTSEFGGCLDELEVLTSGYAALADRFPEVTLLDAREVVDVSADRSLLHDDGVHLTGPAAELVAEAMLPILTATSP